MSSRLGAAALGLILSHALVPGARAQSLGYFNAVLQPLVYPSIYPADWQSTNTLASMLVTNPNPYEVTAQIQTTLFLNGSQVGSTGLVFRVYYPGTYALSTTQITEWSTMSYTGAVADHVQKTGRLPDGSYTLCVYITNLRTASGIPLPPVYNCAGFSVSFPKAPSLVYPSDQADVAVPSPVFQWTPLVAPSRKGVPHQFRLVEVLPQQTPLQAIEANRPVYENYITEAASLPYPSSAPYLIDGRTYAWRVQAVRSIPGRASFSRYNYVILHPIGENEGKSQIFTFTWWSDPRNAVKKRLAAALQPGTGIPGTGQNSGPGELERTGDAGETGAKTRIGSGETFADRIARIMASMWRRGAAAAGARAGFRAGSATSGAGGFRGEGISVPSSYRTPGERDTRLAQSSSDQPPPLDPDGATPEPKVPAASPAESTAVPVETPPAMKDSVPGFMEDHGFGPAWLKLHGTASIAGELYSRDGSGVPARPGQSTRVVTGLSLGLLQDRLRVPIEALVSGDQVAFRQNINQFGVTPRWQWAGLLAGNFSPQYSSYTLADATLLGAGLELTPRQWRIGVVNGRARKAIAPSSTSAIQPQFERNVMAGRVGYGDPLSNTVEFSVMKAEDDQESLDVPDSLLSVTPEANTVYAVKAQGLLPKRHLRAELETALSSYDRDRRANADDVNGKAIGLRLFRETPLSRLGMKIEYLNGGFMTLGNSSVTGDRFDLGVTGRVQLLRGKLSLDGSAGWRNDDPNQAQATEASRRNYTLNGSLQSGPRFGTDFQMSIFKNDASSTDSVGSSSNTTRIISVSPRFAFSTGRIQQALSGSMTLQASDNTSATTAALFNTNSMTFLANWSAVISAPWTVNLSGHYTRTDFEIGVSEISTIGPGFALTALGSKLQSSFQLQMTRSRMGNVGTDTELVPRVEMRWEFARRQAFVFRGNYRRYRYAVPTSPEFNERLASLEYVTNL